MDVAGDKMHAPADAKSPPPQDDAKPPEKETSFQVEVKPESDSDAEDDKSDASEGAWETESLYEDALQLVADEQLRDGSKTYICFKYSFEIWLICVLSSSYRCLFVGRGSRVPQASAYGRKSSICQGHYWTGFSDGEKAVHCF